MSCIGSVFLESAYCLVDTFIVIKEREKNGSSLAVSIVFVLICMFAIMFAIKAFCTSKLTRARWVIGSILIQSLWFALKMTSIDNFVNMNSLTVTFE